MNEILQQRIEEAAEEYANSTTSNLLNVFETTGRFEGFNQGAKFALQNQWISVEEALPPIREKDIGNRSWSDWVLIMTYKEVALMDCYAFHRKEWINNGNDVTHWMHIPELKGGEK